MISNRYTFSKAERLSYKRDIDLLFGKGKSFVAYPFRIIFLLTDKTERSVPVSILISVPKKRFKRAVKRNLIKRQTREAYRLQKHDLWNIADDNCKYLSIAFIYLEKEIHSQAYINKAMNKAILSLIEKIQ